MAIDAGENFAVSALVSVVLLDGVLLERLAARVAREEHHDDFSRFHDTSAETESDSPIRIYSRFFRDLGLILIYFLRICQKIH